jgi:hypothetical protein
MTLTVNIRKLVDFLVPGNCTLHALAELDERHVAKTLPCLADVGERVFHVAFALPGILYPSGIAGGLAQYLHCFLQRNSIAGGNIEDPA